jgi:A/G-specific adenine glycosylase
MIVQDNLSSFSKKIFKWHITQNKRSMPWKDEKNPYKVWLSEIILQQTRVEQGMSYYLKFVNNYPTIQALAEANTDEVFKLWEGLGYYSRCKNLIKTAKHIHENLAGIFPKTYEDILALPGVGPYTAAAIASFAYNLPHAVLDGNVYRILSRLTANATPIDSAIGKKYFTELAQNLLDKKKASTYNQAIMDFGATVCKPKLPLCNTCCLATICKAYVLKNVTSFPVKQNKIVKTKRFFYFVVIKDKERIYVQKRVAGDIWENLWQFPLIESKTKLEAKEVINNQLPSLMGKTKYNVLHTSAFYKQQLTHITVEGCFIFLEVKSGFINNTFDKIPINKMGKIAMPRFITKFLEMNEYALFLK